MIEHLYNDWITIYTYDSALQGFPQSIKASWYHDALNFYPDASVIPMMLYQMP